MKIFFQEKWFEVVTAVLAVVAIGMSAWSLSVASDANKLSRQSNEIAQGGNQIARDAATSARESNVYASQAITIANESNQLAQGAITIASDANNIARESNTLAGEAVVAAKESNVIANDANRIASTAIEVDIVIYSPDYQTVATFQGCKHEDEFIFYELDGFATLPVTISNIGSQNIELRQIVVADVFEWDTAIFIDGEEQHLPLRLEPGYLLDWVLHFSYRTASGDGLNPQGPSKTLSELFGWKLGDGYRQPRFQFILDNGSTIERPLNMQFTLPGPDELVPCPEL